MEDINRTQKLLLAITGASGMLYVRTFLEVLQQNIEGLIVHGICSESGEKVLRYELNLTPEQLPAISKWFTIDNFSAAPSSGSSGYDAMVVLPCTVGSLAAIAGGLSLNLVHRAADVILKEKKKLVLAVRETPLNRNHLNNMLKAHDAGAVICPPFPSYYLNPTTLEEAARTYCWRLADQVGVNVEGRKRWKGEDDV